MSVPYFFKVPKSMVNTLSTDIKEKLYKESWIYPQFVEKIMYNFDLWKETADLDLTYFDSEYEKYKSMVNANWLATEYISKLMKSKYNAEWDTVSIGGRHGVNVRAYFSFDDNCYYVYTLNPYKRKHSQYKKDHGKSYLICIYKIPYEMINTIYGNQDKYEFYIYQYPTGVKFDILNDTEETIYRAESNENWDYGTNIRSDAWPFHKAWWKRNND